MSPVSFQVLIPMILMVSSASLSHANEKPGDRTMGAKAPESAVVLFNGESLEGWVKLDGKTAADWPVADGILTVGAGNIQSKRRFGSFQLHVEFNVPYMPKEHGQGRGNSGVYLDGIYELQVLDSYGLKLQDNDCGAIYKQIVPRSMRANRRYSGRLTMSRCTKPLSPTTRSSRKPE